MTEVIEAVTVADGTGAPAFIGDVAIDEGRVVEVVPREGTGSGLVLAPGFIDSHTHDDLAVLVHPQMEFKVLGGVTTCVVGNCGMGAAPFPVASAMGAVLHPGHELDPWDGYRGYLRRVDDTAPSVNVAALIGHGTVRSSVMGLDDGPPDDDQIAAMTRLIDEGMAAGCVGMSTGLTYEPGIWARTEELTVLAAVVAAAGGIHTSHIRDEGSRLIEAVDEAIGIGRDAGLPVVVSHLKAMGEPNWGTVAAALERIDDAGPAVAADQYPYTASSTMLAAVAASGRIGTLVTPDAVVIASTTDHPEWHGRSLAELADRLGVPGDRAATAVLDAEPVATVIVHSMSEDDVRTVLGHPGIMVGSDGIPSLEGHPHPRLYGTFARVLGRYVRDLGVLGLEEAVHRMTGRPAEVFGLVDRGVIRPGAVADLVLFDPATVVDRGTFDDPRQSPDGIVGVWVNGARVVTDRVHLGTRSGRALRRRRERVSRTGSASA